MCFESVSRTPLSTQAVGSAAPPVNKNAVGAIYGSEDIQQYQALSEGLLANYSASDVEKIYAPVSETVGIRGALNVPAASSYADAKTGLTEIMANSGELASVAKSNNIELCGFLSDLPTIDIDMSAPQLGIPSLQEIMKGINGITIPGLEFVSEGIVGVLGGVAKEVSGLASAIQSQIPTITCGAPQPKPTTQPTTLGGALTPSRPSAVVPTPVEAKPVGIVPSISVESPDVTVQSLNDVLEAGEF